MCLGKPSRPDHTLSKAYRPITLENTVGKVFESVMADTISYLMETRHLLPAERFGGRPGHSTEDATMIPLENIHKAWRDKKVSTAVFMDFSGAFNNVLYTTNVYSTTLENGESRQASPDGSNTSSAEETLGYSLTELYLTSFPPLLESPMDLHYLLSYIRFTTPIYWKSLNIG